MAAQVQGPRSAAEGASLSITAHLHAYLACSHAGSPHAQRTSSSRAAPPPLACMCSSCSARLVVTSGSEEGMVRKVATLTARGRGRWRAVHWRD